MDVYGTFCDSVCSGCEFGNSWIFGFLPGFLLGVFFRFIGDMEVKEALDSDSDSESDSTDSTGSTDESDEKASDTGEQEEQE